MTVLKSYRCQDSGLFFVFEFRREQQKIHAIEKRLSDFQGSLWVESINSKNCLNVAQSF